MVGPRVSGRVGLMRALAIVLSSALVTPGLLVPIAAPAAAADCNDSFRLPRGAAASWSPPRLARTPTSPRTRDTATVVTGQSRSSLDGSGQAVGPGPPSAATRSPARGARPPTTPIAYQGGTLHVGYQLVRPRRAASSPPGSHRRGPAPPCASPGCLRDGLGRFVSTRSALTSVTVSPMTCGATPPTGGTTIVNGAHGAPLRGEDGHLVLQLEDEQVAARLRVGDPAPGRRHDAHGTAAVQVGPALTSLIACCWGDPPSSSAPTRCSTVCARAAAGCCGCEATPGSASRRPPRDRRPRAAPRGDRAPWRGGRRGVRSARVLGLDPGASPGRGRRPPGPASRWADRAPGAPPTCSTPTPRRSPTRPATVSRSSTVCRRCSTGSPPSSPSCCCSTTCTGRTPAACACSASWSRDWRSARSWSPAAGATTSCRRRRPRLLAGEIAAAGESWPLAGLGPDDSPR